MARQGHNQGFTRPRWHPRGAHSWDTLEVRSCGANWPGMVKLLQRLSRLGGRWLKLFPKAGGPGCRLLLLGRPRQLLGDLEPKAVLESLKQHTLRSSPTQSSSARPWHCHKAPKGLNFQRGRTFPSRGTGSVGLWISGSKTLSSNPRTLVCQAMSSAKPQVSRSRLHSRTPTCHLRVQASTVHLR